MRNAVLATEDNRFYEHGALDYKRLFGAVGKNSDWWLWFTRCFNIDPTSCQNDHFYQKRNLLVVKHRKHTFHIG